MDELSVEQVAALRSWIRSAVNAGHPMSQINASLQQKYPKVTATDVMKMSGQDFARSMGQGVTLGHVDELAGLVAKLKGKDYTQARDAMRNQDEQARAANPKMSGAVEMLSGAIPAVLSSAIPGLNAEAGATMANALKGAVQAGGIAGVNAEGSSTAPTARGVAGDVFSLPTAASAALGGLGGAMASKIADRGLPKGTVGKVQQEGAGLLPNKTPDEIRATVARQEQLAPGTTVAADLSPEVQTMARGVGADLQTSMQATKQAEARFRALNQARSELGKQYDILKGQTAPIDPEIVTAVAATGRKGVIPRNATEVDMAKIHDLRSDILGQIKDTMNPKRQKDLRDEAGALTAWMQKQWPAIKGLDSDYAFLSERAKTAQKTMAILKRSAANYGTARAYGTEAGSVGGSLPGVPLPGGAVGVTLKTVGKVLGSADRAQRAKTVADQFLTPLRGTNLLEHLLNVQSVLAQPADHSVLNAGRSAIFGGMLPVGINQLSR